MEKQPVEKVSLKTLILCNKLEISGIFKVIGLWSFLLSAGERRRRLNEGIAHLPALIWSIFWTMNGSNI